MIQICIFIARPKPIMLANPPQDYLDWLNSLKSIDDALYWFNHSYVYTSDKLLFGIIPIDRMNKPWDTWRGTGTGRDCECASLLWADILTRRFLKMAWIVCLKTNKITMYHSVCVVWTNDTEYYRCDQTRFDRISSLERCYENMGYFTDLKFTGIKYAYSIPACKRWI